MSYTWPATLPQLPSIKGWNEKPPELTIRTNMDAGPAKVRRRFTAGVRPQSFSLTMTTAQVAIFDDFFVTTLSGGADRFTWTNPRTSASVEFRFKSIPQYKPISGAYYEVSFELEQMP